MGELLSLLFCFFKAALSGRCNLALENLALRQQLTILKRTQKRPVINTNDRLFWVWLSRFWSEWRASLLIVKPDTVIGWHRKGFVPSARQLDSLKVLLSGVPKEHYDSCYSVEPNTSTELINPFFSITRF
jgi:hypothetical protein